MGILMVSHASVQHAQASDSPQNVDYPTGRLLRDARLYTVGAGTQEIRRMLIGREFNQELLR